MERKKEKLIKLYNELGSFQESHNNYIALKLLDAAMKFSLTGKIGNEEYPKGIIIYDSATDTYHCIAPYEEASNHLKFTADGKFYFKTTPNPKDSEEIVEVEMQPCAELLEKIPYIVNHFKYKAESLECSFVKDFTSEKCEGDLEYIAIAYNSFVQTRILQLFKGHGVETPLTKVTKDNVIEFLRSHEGNMKNIKVES